MPKNARIKISARVFRDIHITFYWRLKPKRQVSKIIEQVSKPKSVRVLVSLGQHKCKVEIERVSCSSVQVVLVSKFTSPVKIVSLSLSSFPNPSFCSTEVNYFISEDQILCLGWPNLLNFSISSSILSSSFFSFIIHSWHQFIFLLFHHSFMASVHPFFSFIIPSWHQFIFLFIILSL